MSASGPSGLLVLLLYSKALPKENILNFTMSVSVKILGVQDAW